MTFLCQVIGGRDKTGFNVHFGGPGNSLLIPYSRGLSPQAADRYRSEAC